MQNRPKMQLHFHLHSYDEKLEEVKKKKKKC